MRALIPVAAFIFGLIISGHAAGGTGSVDREWDGPTSGPVRQADKTVVYISQDFRNGGISANYRGFFVAARELGWQLKLANGDGDARKIRAELAAAIQSRPDAIILGGFQIDETLADLIALAHRANIVIVGWHAAANPGPTRDLFVNIATDADAVARMAAEYMIQSSSRPIGVIIFNDSRFDVANAKTRRMKELIEQCGRCRLLAIENIPISRAATEIPAIVPRLNKQFGGAWTHTLAINDVYFDSINVPLMQAGRTDIQNISAGDGSNKALSRILSGASQQVATIAEPATLQGWQLADELNRAFAGAPPSGYLTKPLLVTTPMLRAIGGPHPEKADAYRAAYRAIWYRTN
jgi:ribose transport system substrate-binding protein